MSETATVIDSERDASTILHIALPGEWEAARRSGTYTVSTRGRSLADEGFIHCSHADQLEAVANAYYGDLDRLVVLTLDVARMGAQVVAEPPFEGSSERFPHVYGPIPVDAVISASEWRRPHDSAWERPTVL